MAIPPPPPGWTRLIVKSKFGAGRDFAVLDADENQVMFVDGKIGASPKADVRDSADQVVYQVQGRFLGIPKRMTISRPDGTLVATLAAKMFSPIKSRMTLDVAAGGTWAVEGSLMEKDYTIQADGRPVAQITQKWITLRDTYTVDCLDGTDPGLVLAIVWAIDRWVERD